MNKEISLDKVCYSVLHIENQPTMGNLIRITFKKNIDLVLNNHIEELKAERATTIAFNLVTVKQTSTPLDINIIIRDPVEPCSNIRSPSRAKPIGITYGDCVSESINPICATYSESKSLLIESLS